MALSLLLALAASVSPIANCQAALGPLFDGTAPDQLSNPINGAQLAGVDSLIALRASRDEALIVINGGNFAGVDLRGANLHGLCFVGTDLAGSDWSDAHAPGTGFVNVNLEGARMNGADLRLVLFRNSNLKDVEARNAVLSGGRLDGGWFDGSVENLRLDGADLSDFRFECGNSIDDGCPIYQGGSRISLNGANLEGANLWGWSDLDQARIDRTEAGLADLWRLRRARLDGPVRLKGGEASLEISAQDYQSLVPFLLDPGADTASPDAAPSHRADASPLWARPGLYALFVDGGRPLDPAITGHPLYARLLPVIVGGSSTRVVVRFNPDSSLDVVGDAVGANGHMCSLSGQGLRLDPQTGYYSGAQTGSPHDPPFWRNRPMAVLAIGGDDALVHVGSRMLSEAGDEDPRQSDYASCGARAGFNPVRRVMVSQEDARRQFEQFGELER